MSHEEQNIETLPRWAIEESLKRAGSTLTVEYVLANTLCFKSILAHAFTITKYEQPPVDPVALVFADYLDEYGCPRAANETRQGERLDQVKALRAALEKNGMLK